MEQGGCSRMCLNQGQSLNYPSVSSGKKPSVLAGREIGCSVGHAMLLALARAAGLCSVRTHFVSMSFGVERLLAFSFVSACPVSSPVPLSSGSGCLLRQAKDSRVTLDPRKVTGRVPPLLSGLPPPLSPLLRVPPSPCWGQVGSTLSLELESRSSFSTLYVKSHPNVCTIP